MFNGGSPTLQGYGGSPAPVAKDSPSTHLVPLSLSSPVPKSLGIRRVHLVKGSPAIQIRGGGRSSPTKFPSSSIAQMNNGGTSTTNPGGVVRASTAMGFISTGEIKLLEEFVTFCMSKDVCQHSEASARAEELRSVAVVGVPSSNKGSCRRCLVMILASFVRQQGQAHTARSASRQQINLSLVLHTGAGPSLSILPIHFSFLSAHSLAAKGVVLGDLQRRAAGEMRWWLAGEGISKFHLKGGDAAAPSDLPFVCDVDQWSVFSVG